jgi:hypothetical protein
VVLAGLTALLALSLLLIVLADRSRPAAGGPVLVAAASPSPPSSWGDSSTGVKTTPPSH